MRWIDRKRPTRHASASKPTSSTEWQLGTLNGLPLYGVVVSIAVEGDALHPVVACLNRGIEISTSDCSTTLPRTFTG